MICIQCEEGFSGPAYSMRWRSGECCSLACLEILKKESGIVDEPETPPDPDPSADEERLSDDS